MIVRCWVPCGRHLHSRVQSRCLELTSGPLKPYADSRKSTAKGQMFHAIGFQRNTQTPKENLCVAVIGDVLRRVLFLDDGRLVVDIWAHFDFGALYVGFGGFGLPYVVFAGS